NKSSFCRSWTLTLLKPLPTGVVTGPFRAILLRLMDARTESGSGVPSDSTDAAPMESHRSQEKFIPVASSTLNVASVTSGPIPSPGISVIVYPIVWIAFVWSYVVPRRYTRAGVAPFGETKKPHRQ